MLIVILVLAILKLISYLWSEERRLTIKGFPKYENAFDQKVWSIVGGEQWSKDISTLSLYQKDSIYDAVLWTRMEMVNDLLANHKELYQSRDTVVKYLGSSYITQGETSGGKLIFGSLGEENHTSFYKLLDKRKESCLWMLGAYCITKYDVAYLAGKSPSGDCWLVFFYDENGKLIEFVWIEAE